MPSGDITCSVDRYLDLALKSSSIIVKESLKYLI